MRFHQILAAMQSAVASGTAARAFESAGVRPTTTDTTQQANRLTATVLAMALTTKFFEGYYGPLFVEKMAEGRKLRQTDPKAYTAAMQAYEGLIPDLQGMRAEMKVIEAMTTSDLAYGLAATRDAIRRDNRPPFATDLYDLVTRRTVSDFRPVQAVGGVTLKDRFLPRTPEGANVQYTGWVGSSEMYAAAKYEIAIAITWEALLSDRFDEWQAAIYQLGQNAARTRAKIVLDAILAKAYFLVLPDAAMGPTIENIQAAEQYLADQDIDGVSVSRAVSDIYVPNKWRTLAATSVNAQTIAPAGTPLTGQALVPTVNPVYGIATVHNEPILTEAPPTDFPGHTTSDWIAADRSTRPVELATLAGFEGGARFLTRIAETVEFDSGSFSNMIFEAKVLDAAGATVTDETGLVVVKGA